MPAKQSTSNYVFNGMLYCFLYAQIEKLTRFPELEVLKDKRCYPADRLRSALVFALSLRGDPNGATRESSGRLGIPPYRPAPPSLVIARRGEQPRRGNPAERSRKSHKTIPAGLPRPNGLAMTHCGRGETARTRKTCVCKVLC